MTGHVLIQGGGIAGPALAHWLVRAGFTATVVEVAPAPRRGGHAVDLRGVCREVVRRMGLLDAVLAARAPERGFAFVDAGGRHLVEMTVDDFGGKGIVSDIEILRGDLADLLYADTRDRVAYRFGDTIAALRDDGDGVRATLAGGDELRADLVVGADGVGSPLRELAFGAGGGHLRPLGAHLAYFTAPFPVEAAGWMLQYSTGDGRGVGIRAGRPGTTNAMFAYRTPDGHRAPADPAAQRRELAERFAGVGWLAPRLLAAAGSADDLVVAPVGQVRLPRWSSGRAVLLGDAGYCPSPITGLGTALALVGAYVLAGELLLARGDHAAAVAAYERRLRPYVAQCQELPPGALRTFLPATRLALAARDTSMRLMLHWPLRLLMERFLSRSDAIALPDYPFAPAPPA
ncbi:monooxygenase [Pilimelia anulata]|uniref:Monooxygenase n=1 Tax=Pilimelia anulata TaxID=53371 RepID=A0A8J3B715_9ACTN|nr:FAD-dependent monooxygenase [Pilimelia anulata]GGJ79752.1 monooxygenase [Pilimelia anulata]